MRWLWILFFFGIFFIPSFVFGQTYGSDFLTATNCSQDTAENGTTQCDKAHNANTADGWLSTNTAFPHWIKFDNGAGNFKSPAKLRIAPYADGSGVMLKNFTLQGSTDDVSYFTLYSGLASNTTNSGVYQDFVFTATTTAYRYFKINLTDSFNSTNQSYLMEVQAMECTANCGGGSSSSTISSSTSVSSSAASLGLSFLAMAGSIGGIFYYRYTLDKA